MPRFLVALSAALFASAAPAADYKLTGDNTTIEFTGTKKDGKHSGGFKAVTGTASADTIDVTIDVESLYSDDAKLTAHLKGGDFFGVKDHPTAKFKSAKIAKNADGTHTVTGDLTLCGKTKEISFPATITAGDSYTLKAEFKINRADFGMTYGKGKVDDEVALKVNVNAKK